MPTSLFGVGGIIQVNVDGTLVTQSFVGTGGQTVFNITAFQYVPGTSTLLVFINGSLQASGRDYTETSQTSFTLVEGVVLGDFIDVIGFPKINSTDAGALAAALAASGGSNLVGFIQPNVGPVARTEQGKLREWIDVGDFAVEGTLGIGNDDLAVLQVATAYCLTYGFKELRCSKPLQISGTWDISNFASGFNFYFLSLAAHASFPAFANWKTATSLIRTGFTGGSMVGLRGWITYVDCQNKADVFQNVNNGCGGSWFHFDRVVNSVNTIHHKNNLAPTASNRYTGSYWSGGFQAIRLIKGASINEGTIVDVNFIANYKYGGVNAGDGSQYLNLRGQFDFNGTWISELVLASIANFNIGDTVTSLTKTAEIIAVYTFRGTGRIIVAETKDVSGGNSNFTPAAAITNGGTGNSTITSITTSNQAASAFYFDVISSLSAAAPFWRAQIICAYLGGIAGNLLWDATVIAGNSNSSFFSWFNSLEVYNSGTTLSLADKRSSDNSFLDVTDDLFAPKRRVFLGTNQFLGLEASVSVPNAALTTLVGVTNGGSNGAVWVFTLSDSTAGIFAKGTIRVAPAGVGGTLLLDLAAVNCTPALSGLNLQVTQGTGATRQVYVNAYRVI